MISLGILSISWSSQSDSRFTPTALASPLPPDSQMDSPESRDSLGDQRKHALTQQALAIWFFLLCPQPQLSPLSLLNQEPSPGPLTQARHPEEILILLLHAHFLSVSSLSSIQYPRASYHLPTLGTIRTGKKHELVVQGQPLLSLTGTVLCKGQDRAGHSIPIILPSRF